MKKLFRICIVTLLVNFATVVITYAEKVPGTVSWISLKGNVESRTATCITNGKIVGVKSSNSSIATVDFKNNDPVYKASCYFVRFKKYGTVTVTTVYEGKDGNYEQKYSYKGVRYSSPLKKLYFGKKNYSSKIKKSLRFTGKPFTGKVKYKTKKGYKLTSARIQKLVVDFSKIVQPSKSVNLKKKITVKKGEQLILTFTNKKKKKQIYIMYAVK